LNERDPHANVVSLLKR